MPFLHVSLSGGFSWPISTSGTFLIPFHVSYLASFYNRATSDPSEAKRCVPFHFLFPPTNTRDPRRNSFKTNHELMQTQQNSLTSLLAAFPGSSTLGQLRKLLDHELQEQRNTQVSANRGLFSPVSFWSGTGCRSSELLLFVSCLNLFPLAFFNLLP